MDQIIKILTDQHNIEATQGKDNDSILIKCKLHNQPVEVVIYYQKLNFQITIGDMICLDRIEDQDMDAEDIKLILGSFLDILKAGQFIIYKHSLLGRVAFSFAIEPIVRSGFPHTQYNSVLDAVVKKVGKKTRLGTLMLGAGKK